MVTAVVSYLVVAALAWWLNRLDATECRGLGFDSLVDGTPLCLVSLLYSLLLLTTGRSLFAGLMVIGSELLLFAVNRLKLSQFKEPVVFVDFGLFVQMIRHPRFYLPYLFPLPVILSVAAMVVGMGLFYRAQPPLDISLVWFPQMLLCFSMLSVAFLAFSLTREGGGVVQALIVRHKPSFDPNVDFARFGLTGSMVLHLMAHAHRDSKDGSGGSVPVGERSPQCVWSNAVMGDIPAPKPHVVLVQAESFFDIRRVDERIDPHLFPNYDRLAQESLSGELAVPAHGAYTMRTEFSVLTGIPNAELGAERLNPYWVAAKQPIWSLARHFKAQGYRCVCVHPYDLHFFNRVKVMPNLGFDKLYGEKVFSQGDRHGPYVSDAALADFILKILGESEEPVFVFAITIEAHGPWSADRFQNSDPKPALPDAPDWGGEEMAVYLEHLRSADGMLSKLVVGADSNARPCVVGLYGDHVGCVPEDRCGRATTNYIVWSGARHAPRRAEIKAENVGELLLSACGTGKR